MLQGHDLDKIEGEDLLTLNIVEWQKGKSAAEINYLSG